MVRFIWVIAVSMPLIIYYILKAEYICRHGGRYSEGYRYKVARNMVRIVKANAFIKTTGCPRRAAMCYIRTIRGNMIRSG